MVCSSVEEVLRFSFRAILLEQGWGHGCVEGYFAESHGNKTKITKNSICSLKSQTGWKLENKY